jgi:putative membrane protein
MKWIANVLINTLAVFLAGKALRGISVESLGTAAAVAVVLGVVSAVAGPLLLVLTLPFNILTLGLFTFAIMAVLVQTTAAIVPGFHVASFSWAVSFAIVMAVLNAVLLAVERRRPAAA